MHTTGDMLGFGAPYREYSALNSFMILMVNKFTILLLVKTLFHCIFQHSDQALYPADENGGRFIGGGIIGSACALRLTERGFKVAARGETPTESLLVAAGKLPEKSLRR